MRRTRDYKSLPTFAPILIGAFVGLLLWLLALDALAERVDLGKAMAPDPCPPAQQQHQIRRAQRQAELRDRRMEMRQIRIEQNQWMRRHGRLFD